MMNQPPPAAPTPSQGGPPYDLIRVDDELILTFSLPGVRSSDFRVSLVGDHQVYLEGSVTYRHPVPQDKLALAERTYGPFTRTVNLPLPVDPGGVTVTFEEALLIIRLPLRLQRMALSWE
ncbi:MAG: Hsp20/alpha crystallin family protein [Mycobacterium leprae]